MCVKMRGAYAGKHHREQSTGGVKCQAEDWVHNHSPRCQTLAGPHLGVQLHHFSIVRLGFESLLPVGSRRAIVFSCQTHSLVSRDTHSRAELVLLSALPFALRGT